MTRRLFLSDVCPFIDDEDRDCKDCKYDQTGKSCYIVEHMPPEVSEL